MSNKPERNAQQTKRAADEELQRMIIEQINSGGPIALAIERAYGVKRVRDV